MAGVTGLACAPQAAVGTLGRMTLAAVLGGPELLIILAIALLLFGGSQLPKLARSLGQAQKEFKKGTDDEPELASGDDAKA
jgi:sec-independent protein translocase protein TatA